MELHHLTRNKLDGYQVRLHQTSNSMVLDFHANLP